MTEPFAVQLRRAREAAGLTQQELAERAGLTVNAISQLERGLRRSPYPHTVRSLADALALADDARQALIASVPSRSGQVSREPPTPTAPVALPTLPPNVVGRAPDTDAVLTALDRGRLVTVTGPGGVGKTTVALSVAGVAADRHAGGVAVVPVAAAADPDMALRLAARQLGLVDAPATPPAELLGAALAHRELLLVLDNLEQVIDVGPALVELLRGCPDLRILATSRVPLRMRGEQVVPVAPLAVPDPADGPAVRDAPACRLLLDHARALGASPIAADELAAVARICRRLDGLPLALELVAGWLRLLSPPALLERLDDALPLLADGPRDLPARQRTMRDTIAWSYELLDEPLQRRLRQLAAFPATWTIAGAAAVTGGSELDVLSDVAQLVERSLVVTVVSMANGADRFRLLEVIREYAAEQLVATGERAAAHERHGTWIAAVGRECADALDGPAQAAALDRVAALADDVRAALRWWLEQSRTDDAGQLFGDLLWFWYLRASGEGRSWLDRVLAEPSTLRPGPLAVAATAAGLISFAQGDLEGAARWGQLAYATAGEAGDELRRAMAATIRATVAASRSRSDETATAAIDARDAAANIDGRRRTLVHGLTDLMLVRTALVDGDLGQVEKLLRTSEDDVRAAGMPWARALWLNIRVGVDQAVGRHDQVLARLDESIGICRRLQDVPALLFALSSLATELAATGRIAEAARTLGAVEHLGQRTGVVTADLAATRQRAQIRATAQDVLGAAHADTVIAEGATVDLDVMLADLELHTT